MTSFGARQDIRLFGQHLPIQSADEPIHTRDVLWLSSLWPFFVKNVPQDDINQTTCGEKHYVLRVLTRGCSSLQAGGTDSREVLEAASRSSDLLRAPLTKGLTCEPSLLHYTYQ